MPAAMAGLGVPPDLFLATSAGGVVASRSSGGGLGRRWADADAAGALSGGEENGNAGQVVGGRGEPGPEVGIDRTSSAHPPEGGRPLLRPEELLDPSADPVDRPAPFGKPAVGLTPRCRIGPCLDADGRCPGRTAPRTAPRRDDPDTRSRYTPRRDPTAGRSRRGCRHGRCLAPPRAIPSAPYRRPRPCVPCTGAPPSGRGAALSRPRQRPRGRRPT